MVTHERKFLAELSGGPATDILHVRDLFIKAAEQNPNVEAVVSIHQASLDLPRLDDGTQKTPLRWSYSQLYQGAVHLAARLDASGVCKGSSIAFFSENRAEWVLLCWTAILLGCPFVPLNPRLAKNKDEVTYVLSQIDPSVIIVVGEEQRSLLELHARQKIEPCLLISLEDIIPTTLEKDLPWVTLKDLWLESSTPLSWSGRSFEDTAVIGFTSGTTSHPKACPQSSENLMISAVAVRDIRSIGPKDRLCQHLPGFAAMAVLINLTCCISGATIVYPSPSFSAAASLDAIECEKCTYTFAAPAIVKALAMHPSVAERSLDSLRIVELGGAPIYPEILQLATSKDGLNCERVGCGQYWHICITCAIFTNAISFAYRLGYD
jgi:acyl-CoA synthetase (AMP-forming)/AMP-acid ligase II